MNLLRNVAPINNNNLSTEATISAKRNGLILSKFSNFLKMSDFCLLSPMLSEFSNIVNMVQLFSNFLNLYFSRQVCLRVSKLFMIVSVEDSRIRRKKGRHASYKASF